MSPLDRVRAIAMAQPRAVEKLSHGMPLFFIDKGKGYAWYSANHHDDGVTAVLVKTGGADEQAMLIEAEPETFFRPAYLGPSGWIGIRLDTGEVDWERIEGRIAQSWYLAASPKLREHFAR